MIMETINFILLILIFFKQWLSIATICDNQGFILEKLDELKKKLTNEN